MASDDFIPIDPILDSNGAFAKLVSTVDAENAKPLPLKIAANSRQFPSLDKSYGQITINAMAKLTAGGLFSGGLNFDERAFYYNAILYDDAFETVPLSASSSSVGPRVNATRWGIGVRIFIRVFDIKSNINIEIPYLSSAIEMQLCKAEYQYVQYGGNVLPALSNVLDRFAVRGPVGGTNLDDLRQVAIESLPSRSAKAGASKAIPVSELRKSFLPIGFKLDRPPASLSLNEARVALYCLKAIKRGDRLSLIKSYVPPLFHGLADELWEMYGGRDGDKLPSAAAKSNTKALLALGGD